MVQVRIDVVHTNGVDAKHLHDGSITEAKVFAGEWVYAAGGRVSSASSRLICDTDDLITITCRIIDEVIALDFDRGNSRSQSGGAEQAEERSCELQKDMVVSSSQ